MKTKSFLLSALATAAIFTSCNERVGSEPQNGAPALLEIKLSDSDLQQTRASGAPVVATETTIVNGMIFVFKGMNADPALDAKVAFTNAAVPIRINITQGIRQIYAVANVNTADFANVNNLSDLQHIANKLSLTSFRTSGSLPMSGYVHNVDASAATTTTPLAVSVPLNFIGSRVHVDWDLNLNSGLTGLTIDGVAFLNVNANSEYIATPNGSGGYNPLTHEMYDYLHGINAAPAFTGTYHPSVGMAVATTNSYDAGLYVASADKGFANNYTYVFENGSQKPMIVTFVGTYSGDTYYWPVVINGSINGIGGVNGGDKSGIVKRATIYNVKAVIKGLGSEDPYAPINPGALDITVVPASWLATVQIDQEFL